MSQAQFTCPLITVIPGQLITSAVRNNEFNNISTNLNPSGVGGYEDTDTQMQIQTAPYPSSVTSHATSLAGEIERIRYQISAILGATTPAYWYAAPPTDLTTLSNITVPIGGIIDFPVATPPNSQWLLANGQAIGRTAYATLFSLIGTTYGIGDGSNTFNLPNYTDRMGIGAGNLYAAAATGGATTHTLTTAELPPLTHNVTDPGHTHTQNAHNHTATDSGHTHVEQYSNSGSGGSSGQLLSSQTATHISIGVTTTNDAISTPTQSGTANITVANATATNQSHTTGITVADTNGGGSHSILNPYLGIYKMIRVS